MACLEPNEVERYVSGELDGTSVAAVESHLVSCSDCRKVTAELARESISRTESGAGRGPAPVSDDLPLGTEIGRFQVRGRLGAGAMGAVYRAYDPELARDVAIKIWHVSRASSEIGVAEAAGRLQREARAQAQLSHPNIVAIYDVGWFGDEVFLAMELVDGPSLRLYLREKRPSRRRILELFEGAGRGLAAAHEAGIIHRDFKPDNVLVGPDGRARIVDFGLAVIAVRGAGASEFAGTPAFMAPEQRRGDAVDGRTDQFSFCLALHDALVAEGMPGAGQEQTRVGVERAKAAAESRSGLPGWLWRALARGMSEEASQRFPDMRALLDALASGRRRRARWRIAGAAAGAALLAGAGVFALQPGAEEMCTGAGERIAEVWNPAIRDRLAREFREAAPAYGEDAWGALAGHAEQFASQWAEMHTAACRATRVSGEQSEALLDARMRCLERRRAQFRELLSLLETADKELIERVPRVASDLPSVAPCGDVEALSSTAPIPEEPAVRRRVEALEEILARGEALRWAGEYKAGIELATGLLESARTVGWEPLIAEASFLLGYLESVDGKPEPAEKHLADAVYTGVSAKHQRIVARAALLLVSVVGVDLGRHKEADGWIRHARAAIDAIGGSARFEAELENNIGGIREKQGKLEEALAHYEKALGLWRERYGEGDPTVGAGLNNIGVIYYYQGKLAQAAEQFAAAQTTFEAALGRSHPYVALTAMNLGTLYMDLGKLELAEKENRRAREIAVAVHGENSPTAVEALWNLAILKDRRGDAAGAQKELLEVFRLQRELHGATHESIARTLNSLGVAAENLGELDRSLAYFEQALAQHSALSGEDGPGATYVRLNVGKLKARLGRHVEAEKEYLRALEATRKLHGDSHPHLVIGSTGLGSARLELGDVRGARTVLEEGNRLLESVTVAPEVRAANQFAFARVLWQLGERARARGLIAAARRGFGAVPVGKAGIAAIEQWAKKVGFAEDAKAPPRP